MANFQILCFLFFLLNFFSLSAQTSVFVSAHPDDWQLFMNPDAYLSVKSGEKVIFIHTTSGDGGNEGSAYYTAREQGSLRAIRFLRNVSTPWAEGLGMDMQQKETTISGNPKEAEHYLQRYTYDNIVVYFVRLPDGGYSGEGTPVGKGNSIQKLYNGTISSILSVDQRNKYYSSADLKETLKSIVKKESTGYITFHIADTDEATNPGDHSDHIYSAKYMEDVAKELGNNKIIYHQGYCTASKPANVTDKNTLWINIATWGVTCSALADYKSIAGTTWQDDHNVYVDKQYTRTVTNK